LFVAFLFIRTLILVGLTVIHTTVSEVTYMYVYTHTHVHRHADTDTLSHTHMNPACYILLGFTVVHNHKCNEQISNLINP